eukprot:CAMPEP_0170481600 /NCGR_PEP_ID=MMETSP0208-20121228/1987_1 /TAXON_ID=197538 /ORGANISM="Strombidium inclinatum, Strain S3" /LENGTH=69 /DNA_ID=CAMNT_0010754335 /DNA_START=37 /DNA_END=246 /DNA_ORIENTATION=+
MQQTTFAHPKGSQEAKALGDNMTLLERGRYVAYKVDAFKKYQAKNLNGKFEQVLISQKLTSFFDTRTGC